MLTYYTTNLFTAPAQTLDNAVNTVGVMGKGIAREFKRRYPTMFDEYRQQCKAGELTIGMLLIYHAPDKIIANLPTKEHWRKPSRIDDVEARLAAFVRGYDEHHIISASFSLSLAGFHIIANPSFLLVRLTRCCIAQ